MELEYYKIPIAVSLIRPTGIDTPFPQHAVNHLREGEPSLPSPVYPPKEVARAILLCAETPLRDVFVGGNSKFASLLEAFAPRFADKIYLKDAFESQSKGTKIRHTPENEGVLHPPRHEGKICGGHIGKIKDHAHLSVKHL